MEDYYHGSNSASFIGVFNKYKPGLKPLSKIIEQGHIPYSGELEHGIANNRFSLIAISVVIPDIIKVAVRYARDFLKPWNPEIGKYNIESINKHKLRLEEKISEKDCDDITKRSYDEDIKVDEAKIKIEQKRIELWKDLSDREKRLILYPYPVIYGINYKKEVINVRSDCPREKGITETVYPKDLVLYVPNSKIRRTKDYSDDQSIINPFKELFQISRLPLDCEREIKNIIERFP